MFPSKTLFRIKIFMFEMRKKGKKFMTLKHDKWSEIVTLLERQK